MPLPNEPAATEPSALRAAKAALQRGDLRSADDLFREQLALTPGDADCLRDYGVFCLRTGRAATACYLLYKANRLRGGDVESLVHLGYARLEVEDFEAARSNFEAALALAPGHASASYGRGLCMRHAGVWSEAAADFTMALSASPDTLPILLSLAEALHRAGDAPNARTHFEQALRMVPDDPAVWFACGKFLRETGDLASATDLIDRCLQSDPDEPLVILEKARCLREAGDTRLALQWLARLEGISPTLPELHEEYGDCLADATDADARESHWLAAIDLWTRAREFSRARSLLDRMLASNPESATGWNALGILENTRQRLDASEAAYRKAIAIDPSRLDAPANLAQLYETTNRLDDSKSVADDALRHARGSEQANAMIELHIARSRVARRQRDFTLCGELLDRIDALGPTPLQRSVASFERGKLMDLTGDREVAMAAFARGNAIALEMWQRENTGRNKALAGVEYMLELVRRGWVRDWKKLDAPPVAADLAFLVGFPRSGTTLLNQVIDSHGAIRTMEEKPPARTMLDAVRSMPAGYPHAIADFDPLDVAYLREAYFRSAAEHGVHDTTALILDKFPMHLTLAGLLHHVFPQARFVFALRHPCDVVLSCFMQNFHLNDNMANFCTLDDTVAFYTRAMDLWEAYREQLPLSVHVVRYEDMVDDFDGETKALCEFLRIPWDESLRQFSRKALARGRINTPSYEQVSRPIYREARYRWQRYREHLAPFLQTLRPYIDRYGYGESTPAI